MKKTLILLLSLILAFLFVSCGSSSTSSTPSTTENKVEKREAVDAYGTVQVKNIESINIDFPAAIEKVNVSENQKIKAGDVLFTLNLKEYQTQIKNKELELDSVLKDTERINKDIQVKTKNVNKDSTSNIDKLSNDLEKLTNDLSNAQNLYKKAQDDLKEKTELFNAGTLSQTDVDECQKQVDTCKKDIDDINFSIKTAKLSIQQENQRITQSGKQFSETKNDEIEQLKVSLDQDNLKAATLKSDLKLMRSKLAKSYLKNGSIISDIKIGVAYDIGYNAGDIADSTKKLLSIADLSSIYVKADVSEDFIKDVKIGAEAEITPVADSSKRYKGKVIRIANKAFEKNGDTLISVDIAIDSDEELLLPGFNVNVSINIK